MIRNKVGQDKKGHLLGKLYICLLFEYSSWNFKNSFEKYYVFHFIYMNFGMHEPIIFESIFFGWHR